MRPATLVSFGATWCGPCRLLAPGLRALAAIEKDRLKVGEARRRREPGDHRAIRGRDFPTCILFNAGEPIERFDGYMPLRKIEAALAATSGCALVCRSKWSDILSAAKFRRDIAPALPAARGQGKFPRVAPRKGMDLGRPHYYVALAMQFLVILSAILSAVTGAFAGARAPDTRPLHEAAAPAVAIAAAVAQAPAFVRAFPQALPVLALQRLDCCWILDRLMNRTRARRVVLLLDCCYAGAFERGLTTRGDNALQLEERLSGRGRAVITASTALEYAFEGKDLADSPGGARLVFTSAIVDGLATGDAEQDQDGMIGLDELYRTVYGAVRRVTPNQTPSKWWPTSSRRSIAAG